MVYKEHNIELIVNRKQVDLGDDFNVRINNVINDPTKMGYTQAEYSYSFNLPATKNNNIIFDYANNLSKLNKFHNRYTAELYADGNLIFEGSLTLNSYKENEYECNLVNVKIYSLDEIFSGMTMNKIEGMEIDFSGVTTMNTMNAETNPICTFPLVSYGAFQKEPVSADTVGATYTSKFDLDMYNRWYIESCYPSINMLDTLKAAFNTKGYEVMGDAFQDPVLKNIYMSTNLADEQVPQYNLGNPAFGNVQIACTSTTWNTLGYQQELQFPYEKVQLRALQSDDGILERYNFDNVLIHDLLSSGVTTDQSPSYMYQPNEHIIVIPKSGFYKIELSATTSIQSGTITAATWTRDEYGHDWYHNDETIAKSLSGTCPIEIALVRNYSDNYELIKGKNNIEWLNGKPEDVTLDWTHNPQNKQTWLTCFPHEDCWQARVPTEQNDLTVNNNRRGGGGSRSSSSYTGSNGGTSASGNFSGYRGSTRGGTRGGTIDPTGGGRVYSLAKYGYMYKDGETMVYDQAVSPAFICGLSSYQGGVNAVMRNGYSWSKSESRLNEVFAPVVGYGFYYRPSGTTSITFDSTDYNYNTYINTPFFGTCTANTTNMSGNISCIAWLEKDDVLQLFGVTRAYFKENGEIVQYNPTTTAWLRITAFSDRNYNLIKADKRNCYCVPDPDSPYHCPDECATGTCCVNTEYSEKLNLANFLNQEKEVKEWIEDITKAFNLEMSQYGNTVQFNTKKTNTNLISSVYLDDRVNSYDIKSEKIDYPKSMAVQYKVDTDEWGFERSAVEKSGGSESILNTDDWYKYGDSGFTKIILNDDAYVTNENNVTTNFSYTWYQNFNHYQTNSAQTEQAETATTISIPCISKYSYMFDGYDYTESMKHDGYSLTPRFWFKPDATNLSIWTRTYPAEELFIYTPKNTLEGLNLSYKDTENSLLQRYFNPQAYLSSNIIDFEVYLTSDEYNLIKSGAAVHVDKDVYLPLEISGYSPSGDDPAQLRLMKHI